MMRLFIGCSLLLSFWTCQQAPETPANPCAGLFPVEQFTRLWKEVYLIEAMPDTSAKLGAYQTLLLQYGLTADSFQGIIKCYLQHPEVLLPINQQVINELSDDTLRASTSPSS